MPDVNDLRRQRSENARAARKILDDAEDAGRELTAEESAEFDRLMAEADQLEVRVRHHEYGTDPNRRVEGPVQPTRDEPPETPGGGLTLRTDDGRTVRAAEPHESLSDVAPVRGPGGEAPEGVSLGRALHAAITGDWSRAPREYEVRDQVLEHDPSGGYLLSPAMSGLLIDQARNQTVLVRAGARTVPLDTATTKFVTIESDPTAGWIDELETLPETGVTFGALELHPKTLAAQATMSVQLAEDAANAPEQIEGALRDATAVQLDSALLNGLPDHPWLANGVLGHPDVNTVNAGRTSLTYDHVLQGMRDVGQNNGTADAAVFAERDQFSLDTLKDANNQYLQPPARYREMRRKFTSTQMPTTLDTSGNGTDDESKALVGNLSSAYVLFGIRRDLRVEATRTGAGSFETLAVKLRVHGRFDIAVGRPNHLSVVEQIVA